MQTNLAKFWLFSASLNDLYNKNAKDNAVLILEDDIINDSGYGLKKGFYNVKPDKYMEFLLISEILTES